MKVLFAAASFSAFLSACMLVNGYIDFKNLICNSWDKPFLDFEYCFLKSVNRTYKYMSVKVNLFKGPVTDVAISFALLKKANGFKPFLYNITFDACKYLKSRNKHKVITFFHDFIQPYTNMKHPCPYDHDLYVDELPISHMDHMFGKLLPLPDGEYQIDSIWRAYNIPRGRVQLQFVKG